MKKKFLYLLVLLILIVPTFVRMVRPGIFSTQDFHFFRLLEFDKCVQNLEIPCRWAPDAGLGYGEPLFNFYTQLPYVFGELFHIIGFQLIDSLKISFVFSLIFSGISMYILASKLWGNKLAALVSSIVYVYAPYRAVDVWVRGALPEAMSFIFFPLILFFLDKSIEEKGIRNKLLLGLMMALSILNHNLSFLMFIPVIVIWTIYRLLLWKKIKSSLWLIFPIVLAICLSAFYILPVIFESKYIDLASTTVGYFDFRAHFVTISQLLVSRFWGYGGSTWGDSDGLSLAVGQVQWIVPVLLFVALAATKKLKGNSEFLTLFILGWAFLFLTHNKSTILWENIDFMKYIQFPWRFLSIAVFCFSLCVGAISKVFKKKLLIGFAVLIVGFSVLLTINFFKEDIWYNYADQDLVTGENWILQRTASIGDFWPLFGHKIPNEPASGEFINYFPGWKQEVNGLLVDATPDERGLILAKNSRFENTPVRTIGNTISLISVMLLIALYLRSPKLDEK